MAYSVNVTDASKRQVKDSMSGYARLLTWPRLGHFWRNAIFFPTKDLNSFWEHNKPVSCEHIYLWIESLCNLNAWHEGQHNGSQAYVYLPRASRGVYSNKLASVIIHPKVILDTNPYKAHKVLVVYLCSLKDKIHVCLS